MYKIQQFYVLSLTEENIRGREYNVYGAFRDFQANEEIVALADNECLREIRRITNHPYDADMLERLLQEKKAICRKKKSLENAQRMAKINEGINSQLYIPEFAIVQTEEKRKYGKLNRHGFKINGEEYTRLMCGAGHARTNRAMFVRKKIFRQLDDFLRCGCKDIDIIWAKWNAYYALSVSSTYVVRKPRVAVVKDCEVKRNGIVDFVSPGGIQPKISRESRELTFNLFDGMGLISPDFATKWGEDIGCSYTPSAFIIRCAFIKGLVATFDFKRFAIDVAGKNTITDIYGNEVNVQDVDLILTESQFKLSKAYDSWNDYVENVEKHHWNWGVTKCADEMRDIKRCMRTNYQFVQTLKLSDHEIESLCSQTVDWLSGISCGSYEYTLLYLLGKIADADCDTNEKFNRIQDPFIKCLLVEPDLIYDPYIKKRIETSIAKKAKEACMGRLIIDCTYQLLISDPYAFCEYVFGMEIDGLIQEHTCYNKYWQQKKAKNVCSLRSPLTWRSEVNGLNVINDSKADYWYQYLDSCHIQNVHGLDSMLNSGSDMDGDCLFITDNKEFWNGRC